MGIFYGFIAGKNKKELGPLFASKQDKHITRTVTLVVANWSNKTQTVSVDGVSATNTVIVAPAPEFYGDYVDAGIICTAQASGALTFTCSDVPSSAISVNVVILEV